MPPCNALFLINPPLAAPVVKPFKSSKGGVFGFDQQKRKIGKAHAAQRFADIQRVCVTAAHT